MVQQTFTLFDLNEQIRRTIALNFPHPIWVKAEIAQLNESQGHFYLELVEKSESDDLLKAKATAILWQSQRYKILQKVGKLFHQILLEGQLVSLQVMVEFDERYGLKLLVQDLDIAYTLGQLKLKRSQILDRLEQLKLLDQNKQKQLPKVIQRIAVLSSEKAAGYADFQSQLKQNHFGYAFKTTLFPIAVQGAEVPKDLLKQLKRINRRHTEFDCVAIIRGGGARLDLASFDHFEIGEAIALSKIPVVSGIGHDTDETIVDLVANTSLKTPTAVAEFFIQNNATFENHLDLITLQIKREIDQKVHLADLQLSRLEEQYKQTAKQKLELQNKVLGYLELELRQLYKQRVLIANKDLQKLEQLVDALDFENNLKRGFTLTQRDNKIVHSVHELKKGDTIMTRFINGGKLSIVN